MATWLVRNPIGRLRAWLLFADYDAAKEAASLDTASRYSRGNIAVQNGRILDKRGLDKLSEDGDDAAEALKEKAASF